MNDLVIKVSKRSRLIDLDHSTLGIVGENLQEKLIFTFQDEFVDGMARLEYELDNEKRYVLMDKVGQSYILPVQNVLLTKEGNIDLQLVITEDKTGTPVFKSEVFTLYCKKSIEAVGEAPSSYELWIEKANRILLEASRVNIDGKKTGNETIITITQKDGNKKSFPILDGQDGQQGPQGPVGPQGPQGPEGPQGSVGPTPDLSNYVQKPEFNESQAEQDDTTRELQAELDRYKLLENALPHTENETESDYVTLENTAKSPMEVSLKTQTSQETTTGKNLLKITNLISSSNGITPSLNSDGSISYSGTATATASIFTNYISCDLEAGNYTFSRYKSLDYQTRLQVRYEDETTQSFNINASYNYANVTFSQKVTSYRLSINGLIANNQYNDTLYLQLELGSEATSYEPYTGGIPAPNPDFPMDIHCTTGENNIKVVGKNLFDKNNFTEINAKIESGSLISNNNERLIIFKCEPNTTYSFTKLINSPYQRNYVGETSEYPSIGASVSNTAGHIADVSFSYTTTSTAKYIVWWYYCTGSTQYTKQQILDNIQIEQSSSATSYTPYEETTYPISLGDKEMFNINGVYDGFVYDESVDKFYIERKNGKVVLNGSATGWSIVTNAEKNYYRYRYIENAIGTTTNLFSNLFLPNNISTTGTQNGCTITQSGEVRLREENMKSLSDWLTFLNATNLILIYQLATSTLEEVTDATLISQLRAIKNALSMQGTTHIISTSSGTNLPFLIKARAVQTIERT